MKTVDTKGRKCPRPLIMLKQAIDETAEGEMIEVITDSNSALRNMMTYLKDQGVEPEVTSSGEEHILVTPRPEEKSTQPDPEDYCNPEEPSRGYVVCIKSEYMGEGDPELGKLLMATFLENLKLQENLPEHVVLYNGGVKLAMKSSELCASLVELETLGTRIVLCGTCVDHYGLQYELGVGMISNMISITGILASTGHVIYP